MNHAEKSPMYKHYFEISSKLFRIYSVDTLFETFVSSLRTLFGADFCFLYLPAEKSRRLQMSFMCGTGFEELTDKEIHRKSAIFDLLHRKPNAYVTKDLLELTDNDFDLQALYQSGTELIAPVSMPENKIGLLGMSKRSGETSTYSLDDREMIFSLSQMVEIILENIHQFKKIEELSYTDSMTKLYNYRYFYKRLNEEIFRAKRFKRFLGLVIFDIDDFKVFNDSFGHQTGDHILRQLGSLLLESVRSIDIVCRYGGEEFCIIMPESGEDSCSHFVERLRVKLTKHIFENRFGDEKLSITLSAGCAIFPSNARRCDRLIYCADMALLEAKKAGRNKCCIYSELKQKSKSKHRK